MKKYVKKDSIHLKRINKFNKKTIAKNKCPVISIIVLVIIMLGCVFANVITTRPPEYMDLVNYTKAPGREFWFGTDTMGRDMFSCIWYGGRVSIAIGILSTVISTIAAVIYGSISAVAGGTVDTCMMRFAEIILSIPTLLLIVFLQAIMGKASVISISVVIGLTSWCAIAKIVRTEVKRLKESDYVTAAKTMGGGFFHILLRHLAPNFMSSIMFMVVMNVRSAIVAESTLSFMGIGLPIDVISWGSMLSLAQNAIMTGAWWIILVPGIFLVTFLMCITNIGHWMQMRVNHSSIIL